jgi:hypothetical protein
MLLSSYRASPNTEKPPHFRAGGLPVSEMNFTPLSTTSATEMLCTLRAGGLPVSNVSDGGGWRERWHQVSDVTLRLEARRGPQPSRLGPLCYVAMVGNSNHLKRPQTASNGLKPTLQCLGTFFGAGEVIF